MGSNNEATLSTSMGFSLDPSLVEGEDERRRFVDAILEFLEPEDLLIAFGSS